MVMELVGDPAIHPSKSVRSLELPTTSIELSRPHRNHRLFISRHCSPHSPFSGNELWKQCNWISMLAMHIRRETTQPD